MSKKFNYLAKRYECHEGTKKVFTDPISKLDFYGGGKFKDLVIHRNHLIISLLGSSPSDSIRWSCVNSASEKLDKYKLSVIEIDWSDGDALNFKKDFWIDLLSVIRTEKKDVTIYCLGGHGRTGTALSILASMCGVTDKDPVQYIRDKYCNKVVETQSQIDYIEEITDKVVSCKPKHIFYEGIYGHFGIQKKDNDTPKGFVY